MKKEGIIHILAFLGVLFLDLFTKYFVREGCLWVFCIDRAFNTGASFGILEGMTSLFIVVGSMILVLMGYFYNKVEYRVKWAFVFIGAGTLGNLLDRMLLGGVMDWIRIWQSSSFNIADISNVIGGAILLWVLFFDGKKK